MARKNSSVKVRKTDVRKTKGHIIRLDKHGNIRSISPRQY